jgi:alkanesulfonate monooxygenase SsuD/methylene tetrahydromethanopterin reductase-like flavin-dependent oxidoreductase (luciferase family)/hemerythrin-like domain-containing protein
VTIVDRPGDLGHPLVFGAFITPDARNHDRTMALARLADTIGLDVVGVQDHPYQPSFLDSWTMLSALATQTTRVKLFPDVATLPLRPPSVLARAAASLDLLSDGRMELGLGAGAFPKAVASMGGPARTPGESVEALEEAIEVIRALWASGERVSFKGKHYSLANAQRGPAPLHPIGIFVGSYKPRMLRLTGRLADGWIPTSSYASPSEIKDLAAIIDEAAIEAGRTPGDVRRWYNVIGSFASRKVMGSFTSRDGDFLHGRPALWVEQLTELALDQGVSGFILGAGAAAEADLRRFAEEVVPAVRAAVAEQRGVQVSDDDAQLDLAPSERTTGRVIDLDESTRPHLRQRRPDTQRPDTQRPDTQRPDTQRPDTQRPGAQAASFLVQVHDHLRSELEQLRAVVTEVAAGQTSPALARSLINRMSMRQNYWSLGAFFAANCRVLTNHHAIEDSRMFADLKSRDESLTPVIERLSEEHEVIAGILTRLDEALVLMVDDASELPGVQAEVERLSEVLLSHLDYEEEELLGPIARLGIEV